MTTKGLGGRKAEAERNDRLVLAAATEVFLELGFDAPMSVIAERAGVGMGSLYRRYRSKEELARRLCADSMRRVLEGAERALAQEPDGWSALARFMREAVACGAGALSGFAGAFPVNGELVDLSVRAADAMQAIMDRAQREGTLRADVTPADLTYICNLLRAPLTRDQARLPELRTRYLDLLLEGLRSRPGQPPLAAPAPDWPEIAARWTTLS